mgnify:CR=1 FL=1
MNWEIIWTTLGIGVGFLFLLPFYIAMLLAFEKGRAKIHLEYVVEANLVDKKMRFDESVERLFEEEGTTE